MKKILFTALTVGSSMAEIAHSNDKLRAAWDEPSSHELIGAKAEDVYYFDDIGNLLGHFGQEAKEKAERIRHVAGMDVDTEVPAAKMITEKGDSLAEASSDKDKKEAGGDDSAAADDEQEPRAFPASTTPEEKVAKTAVTSSEKYKRAALKAAKEAAVSKSVATRATENAHAF